MQPPALTCTLLLAVLTAVAHADPGAAIMANPFAFSSPIYHPRAFTLKYNGHDLSEVSEHRLRVDLEAKTLRYEQERHASSPPAAQQIRLMLKRGESELLPTELIIPAVHGQQATLPADLKIAPGDTLWPRLETKVDDAWQPVGKDISVTIREGAPFTFGRALGLGSEDLHHGSTLHLDGVAVFNRVLTAAELRKLSFID